MVGVVWSVEDEQFHEVEVPSKKSPRYYEWRRREMARMIVYEGMTLRQVADIFGIHNCNVYRALSGILGTIDGKISGFDVQMAWDENKKVSLERANAAKKRRKKCG